MPAVLVLVVVLLGLTVAALAWSPTPGPDDPGAAADARSEATVSPPVPDVPQPTDRRSARPERPDPVVAWGRGGLPEGYAEAVATDPDVTATTVVRAAVLKLVRTEAADGTVVDELPDGWAYPVEVLAVEPDAYVRLLDVPEVADLAVDEALLSTTSAEVRGLDTGDHLIFEDGTELTVTGVVADELIGAGEVVVHVDGPLPVDTERYVLAFVEGEAEAVGEHLRELAGDGRGVEVASSDEVPVLRHAATVTPPARAKEHFGEFAVLDQPGRAVRTGYSWLQEHIVFDEVPLLGRIECHREMFPPLRAAFQELIDRGLGHLVDPSDYGGCWVPRTSSGAVLSSHAWGTAIDLNVSTNHLGMEPSQPEELIEVMASHGFVWGGEWLVPDGMHFELAPDRETG
jgi:hypothetical protein